MRRLILYVVLLMMAAGVAYLIADRLHPPRAEMARIAVYFTDRKRFEKGEEPYEASVLRTIPAGMNLPGAVLTEYFKGPTAAERQRGLAAVTSGFTGFSKLTLDKGVARVYLTGTCASNGAAYTVAQPIMKNLLQFGEIKYVKIYDAEGETEEPEGPTNSIPFCLEP